MKHRSPYRRGLFDDMKRGFTGPQRGLMILIFVCMLAMLGLSAVFFVWLVTGGDTRSQVICGVLFLASFLSMGLLKLGYFQRLDRLAILDAIEEIGERQKP